MLPTVQWSGLLARLADHSQNMAHCRLPPRSLDGLVMRFFARVLQHSERHPRPAHVAPWFARALGLDEQPQLSSQRFHLQRWLEGTHRVNRKDQLCYKCRIPEIDGTVFHIFCGNFKIEEAPPTTFEDEIVVMTVPSILGILHS